MIVVGFIPTDLISRLEGPLGESPLVGLGYLLTKQHWKIVVTGTSLIQIGAHGLEQLLRLRAIDHSLLIGRHEERAVWFGCRNKN